jgi:hypothetical protein
MIRAIGMAASGKGGFSRTPFPLHVAAAAARVAPLGSLRGGGLELIQRLSTPDFGKKDG